MSENDVNSTRKSQLAAELEVKVKAFILDFMDRNNGTKPTNEQVRQELKGSFRELSPAIRAVKARLDATQTRLANSPDIPDALRLAHEQSLKDLWCKVREMQNGEIVDLKRSQAVRDEEHRLELDESQEVIEALERELGAESQRAEVAEARVIELTAQMEAAQITLAAADARLAERDEILALLAAHRASSDVMPVNADAGEDNGKDSRRVRKFKEPETVDLPGVSPQDLAPGRSALS